MPIDYFVASSGVLYSHPWISFRCKWQCKWHCKYNSNRLESITMPINLLTTIDLLYRLFKSNLMPEIRIKCSFHAKHWIFSHDQSHATPNTWREYFRISSYFLRILNWIRDISWYAIFLQFIVRFFSIKFTQRVNLITENRLFDFDERIENMKNTILKRSFHWYNLHNYANEMSLSSQ